MTEEEDRINEQLYEIIKQCDHDPVNTGGRVVCRKCGCSFAVVLPPRLAKPFPVPTDYDGLDP